MYLLHNNIQADIQIITNSDVTVYYTSFSTQHMCNVPVRNFSCTGCYKVTRDAAV
uniref:Uncharacterized protein n=1 Tax=Anguilla anguilla TaxID=7936 RepID=A0A0E9WXP8_ANGAN